MTRAYTVVWVLETDAESPEEAAAVAREIQLDPHTIATVFLVRPHDGETLTKVDELENGLKHLRYLRDEAVAEVQARKPGSMGPHFFDGAT